MPWFNVDDAIPDMPEVMRIPRRYRLAAMGLWTLAGGWASKQLTGGYIPDEIVELLGGTATLKAQLIQCGLWREAPDGAEFTDRGCRVPTAEGVRKQRGATAERVRKHRGKRPEPVRAPSGDRPEPVRAPSGDRPEPVRALSGTDKKSSDQDVDVGVTVLHEEPITALHGIHTSSKEPKGSFLLPNQAEPSGSVSAPSYVSNAPARINDDTFELATSERGLSPPISVGASRLVAIVFPNGEIDSSARTMLRIKASEALASGRSDDDVAECLRIWRTKNDLGPNGLLCCLTEVDKRKINTQPASTSDQRFMAAQAWKNKTPTRMEITNGP